MVIVDSKRIPELKAAETPADLPVGDAALPAVAVILTIPAGGGS